MQIYLDRMDSLLMIYMPCAIRFKYFRDVNGLSYYMTNSLSDIEEQRLNALKAIANFRIEPSLHEIVEGGDCKKCRDYLGKLGPICSHCKIKVVLDSYETSLLSYREEYKVMKSNRYPGM